MFVTYKCMFFLVYFPLKNGKLARLQQWRYQNSYAYRRRENTYIFSSLDLFGLMKFCENVSILNTKPIKFSATTPVPFSKKFRQERHKRIKRRSVPETVK